MKYLLIILLFITSCQPQVQQPKVLVVHDTVTQVHNRNVFHRTPQPIIYHQYHTTIVQPRHKISRGAKDAIIGGVVGAGAGALIDKKHRGAGAIIGGAAGAGGGYLFGHSRDKKH